MTDIRPLPARVLPLVGESLLSLLRRTIEVMGYEGFDRLRFVLSDTGKLPYNVNSLGPGTLFDHLAILLGLSQEALRDSTFHGYASDLVLVPRQEPVSKTCDSKTLLKYFTAEPFPVCPICLGQDLIPHERLSWCLRAMPACLEHRCWLLSHCPSCGKRLQSFRPKVTTCRCGCMLTDRKPPTLDGSALKAVGTLRALFLSRTNMLAGMEPPAMCWWTERLASAVGKIPHSIAATRSRLGLEASVPTPHVAWLAAGDIVGNWPEGLYRFLDQLRNREKPDSSSISLGFRFRLLLRDAAQLENLGYATPAQAIRDHLADDMAAGHLGPKVSLFMQAAEDSQLRRPDWITQTEAARRLNVRNPTVRKLIRQGLLSGQVRTTRNSGRTVAAVSRKSVEDLEQQLPSALDVRTVAERLGIGPHAVLSLIHDGVLTGLLRAARRGLVLHKSLLRLEKLIRTLPREDEIDAAAWLSLRQATRIFGASGLTLSQLVSLILEGNVPAVRGTDSHGLNSLHVRRVDLEDSMPKILQRRDEAEGVPIHRLAKTLFPARPVKVGVLKKWIALGFLFAKRVGRTHAISIEEIRQFRATFCLADEACRRIGITRKTLSTWERLGCIVPMYGRRVTPGAGFSLYRLEDVDRLVLWRTERGRRIPPRIHTSR